MRFTSEELNMAQIKPEWEVISEWDNLMAQVIGKFHFDHVDPSLVIAYKCINKSKPEGKTKLYDMSGQTEPEAFTNSKKYFVKLFHNVWDVMDQKNRLLIVFSALSRIDKVKPDSGKVSGFDLHDQSFMARTFGVDWATRSDIPNILTDNVRIVEEAKVD